MKRWKDKLGIAASVTCAIHCAATPILLAFLPALKFTEWMASPQFHQVAAIICVSLVAISIWPAFRKFRDYRVLSLSTAGLTLIVAAAFLLPDHCCSHTNVASAAPVVAGTVASNPIGDFAVVEKDGEVAGKFVCTNACCSTSVFSKHRSMLINRSSATSGEVVASDAPVAHSHTDLASTLFGSELVAAVQPWLTPIGGMLLVFAHALNLGRVSTCRSKRCVCSTSVVMLDRPNSLAVLQDANAA